MLALVNGLEVIYLVSEKGIHSSSVTNRANGTYTNQLLAASRVLYTFTVTECRLSKLVTGCWMLSSVFHLYD